MVTASVVETAFLLVVVVVAECRHLHDKTQDTAAPSKRLLPAEAAVLLPLAL